MVKKGKALEILVGKIQEVLKDKSNTSIEVGVHLTDKEGISREFDVLVRVVNQGLPSTIAFECKDYSTSAKQTKVDIKIVDALIGKCADLPEIHQKVIVSTTGFSDNAKIKAKANGIILCSLETVNIKDLLLDAVVQIPVAKFEIGEKIQIEYKSAVDSSSLKYPIKIYRSDNNQQLNIQKVIHDYLYSIKTTATLVKEYILQDKQSLYKLITIGFEKGAYIFDKIGNKHLLEVMIIPVKVDFEFIEGDVVNQQVMRQGSVDIKVVEHGFRNADLSCVSIQVDDSDPRAFIKRGDEIISPNFHMSFVKQSTQ